MIKKYFILFFILGLIPLLHANAQGENLTLKIVVVGPGDELYLWWGHISLIIEDSVTGRSTVYDYGRFSFEQDNFYYNFAFGRLYYDCGASDAQDFLITNSMENRDIIIYTLDVPPQKRIEVKKFAENNVLPENRIYEYHHFKDNCSTRIRDIIDLATDGQFYNKYNNEEGRFTLRRHIRRFMWFSPPADWILNFWMGQVIDTPITVWEEMFLPQEVGKRIEEFTYIDSEGKNRSLVRSVEIYNRAVNRPAVLEEPKKNWHQFLIFSLSLSVIFGFFFYLNLREIRTGQILSGLSMSICALIFGIAGSLLYFMSLFTNHDYTFKNINMIFCSPVLLIAVPFGILYAFTRNQDKKIKYDLILRIIWLLTVMGVFISMLLKILPVFYQQNLADQLLMLPIALVFSFQPAGLSESMRKFTKKAKRQ